MQDVNTQFTTGPTVCINGGVTSSETVLVDGMDGTNLMGQGLGPIPRTDSLYQQFESIASLTWVKNHTFKFGGELNGGRYTQNFSKAVFAFSSAQTAKPYLYAKINEYKLRRR